MREFYVIHIVYLNIHEQLGTVAFTFSNNCDTCCSEKANNKEMADVYMLH